MGWISLARPCAQSSSVQSWGLEYPLLLPSSLGLELLPGPHGMRHLSLLGWAPGQGGDRTPRSGGTKSSTFCVLWPRGGQTGNPRGSEPLLGEGGAPNPDTRRPGSVYVSPGCRGTGTLPPAGAPAARCRRSPSAGSLQEAAAPGGGSVLGVRPLTRTRRNSHTQPSVYVSRSHASGTVGPSNANARPGSPMGLL